MKPISIRLPPDYIEWLGNDRSTKVRELIKKAIGKEEVEETAREVLERLAREMFADFQARNVTAESSMQEQAELALARLFKEE